MFESGESFARLRDVPDAAAVPLQIELLERDQVPLDLYRDIGGGARIRAGIEFNGEGQSTAYWVSRDRPGDRPSDEQLQTTLVNANVRDRTQSRKGSRSAGMNLGKSIFDSEFPTPVLSASRTFSQTDEKDH